MKQGSDVSLPCDTYGPNGTTSIATVTTSIAGPSVLQESHVSRPMLMDAAILGGLHREPTFEGLKAARAQLERRIDDQAAVLAVEQAMYDSLWGELSRVEVQI